ncbi:uncharacterized protein [Triticum aestivum]|uniref:uncharacterized protein n=1 Tax=Triticum aestivum TaxID=4565 RepID=UPI001D01B919|nr:uncharacterized protein LOC123068358 [Triticum aestivum]
MPRGLLIPRSLAPLPPPARRRGGFPIPAVAPPSSSLLRPRRRQGARPGEARSSPAAAGLLRPSPRRVWRGPDLAAGRGARYRARRRPGAGRRWWRSTGGGLHGGGVGGGAPGSASVSRVAVDRAAGGPLAVVLWWGARQRWWWAAPTQSGPRGWVAALDSGGSPGGVFRWRWRRPRNPPSSASGDGRCLLILWPFETGAELGSGRKLEPTWVSVVAMGHFSAFPFHRSMWSRLSSRQLGRRWIWRWLGSWRAEEDKGPVQPDAAGRSVPNSRGNSSQFTRAALTWPGMETSLQEMRAEGRISSQTVELPHLTSLHRCRRRPARAPRTRMDHYL